MCGGGDGEVEMATLGKEVVVMAVVAIAVVVRAEAVAMVVVAMAEADWGGEKEIEVIGEVFTVVAGAVARLMVTKRETAERERMVRAEVEMEEVMMEVEV